MVKVSQEHNDATLPAGCAPSSVPESGESPHSTRPYHRDSHVAISAERYDSTEPASDTSQWVAPPEPGARVGHYRVDELIGRGGMGLVYSAVDVDLEERVALKLLTNLDAARVYAFKQEFRRVADVFHPNLAQMRELLRDRERWFLAMEFVDGVDFVRYVRGRGEALSEEGERRLRRATAQLVRAVDTLHTHGIVHCDLKPSNVLVTASGRVVVLDFGITYAARAGSALSELGGGKGSVLGTPTHIAPECARGQAPTPAADWYALGVILFETLCGELPFDGRAYDILIAKQSRAARLPDTHGLPNDLCELTLSLLERDPEARPQFDEILARLRADVETIARSTPPSDGARSGLHLVGRTAELVTMRTAFEGAASASRAVFVHGAAGVGKSTLVEHFLRALPSETTVLKSRCHEREAVPFRAVDSLVDELVRKLHAASIEVKAEAIAALGPHVADLVRVFPLFGGLVSPGEGLGASPDPAAGRLRAFGALKRVVQCLAARAPLVVLVEDVHWGDADSVDLLAEWFSGDVRPGVLLLATFREQAQEGAFLSAWANTLRTQPSMRPTQVEVVPLNVPQALRLVHELWPNVQESAARRIAVESGGVPLFVEELTRFAAESSALAESSPVPSFTELVQARVDSLPEGLRRALELIALSPRPISHQVVARAGGWSSAVAEITRLRSLNLARFSGVHGEDTIEPYHARIGDCLRDALTPALKREHHASLARALNDGPAELLAFHLHGAGELERAAHHAERAADLAFEALAFQRAADFYANALEWSSGDDTQRARLLERRAAALFNAGRTAEAAPAFCEAADADNAARDELCRRAAESYLLAGHVEAGLAVAAPLLAGVDLALPKSERVVLFAIVKHLLRLKWRGLRSRGGAPPDEVSYLTKRADLTWALGKGLSGVLPFYGLYFCLESLLTSLRLGEPARIARVLGNVGACLSIAARRSHAYLEQARDLAESSGSAYAVGLNQTWSAMHALFIGDWLTVAKLAESASESFEQSREGSCSWEHNVAAGLAVIALSWRGKLNEASSRAQHESRLADGRGDLYGRALFTQTEAFCALAEGRIEDARHLARGVVHDWAGGRYTMQHAYSMRLEVLCLLYEERPIEAERHYLEELSIQRRHGLQSRSRSFADFILLEATIRLSLPLEIERKSRLMSLSRLARRLRRHVRRDGAAHADVIDAARAFRRGKRARAEQLLARATALFEALEMQQYAWGARFVLAEMAADDTARENAEQALFASGVAVPRAWVRIVTPGFGN